MCLAFSSSLYRHAISDVEAFCVRGLSTSSVNINSYHIILCSLLYLDYPFITEMSSLSQSMSLSTFISL